MHIRDHRLGFGLVTILLHWLVAITTIGLFVSGLWMTGLDYYSRWYNDAPAWHKSVGLLLAFVVAIALAWRLVNARPEAVASVPCWQQRASRAMHFMLLIALLVTLASGYLIPTADGRGVEVFGWFTVPALPAWSGNQEDLAGAVHLYGAWVLIALVGGHALAALKHHFLDRDRTLQRMIDPRD